MTWVGIGKQGRIAKAIRTVESSFSGRKVNVRLFRMKANVNILL